MSSSRFYTSYTHVLPNELDVIKFTDSYYNNKSQFTAQINDMGCTINAISYLTSKWFCSNSKLIKSNILDARGCWQIKKRADPVNNKYTVTIEYKLVDGKIKYSILNSASSDGTVDTGILSQGTLPQDVWRYFNELVIKFIRYMNGRMNSNMHDATNLWINRLNISYQIKKQNGNWYYIIDNIMMPDDFTISKTLTGTEKDEYCFFNAEHITITEVEINECYNRLFKILENCPGFINMLTDGKPNMQITKRILYDAKTIEKYITDANIESNGRYYS